MNYGLTTVAAVLAAAAATFSAIMLPPMPAQAQGKKPTALPIPGVVLPTPPPPSAANGLPRIVFAGNPLPVPSPAQAPYRDPTDNMLCLSPESLAPLGVTYVVDEKAAKVTLAGPDGTVTTTVDLRVPPKGASERSGPFIPAVETIEGLGGKCEWNAATNTMFARAVLTSVEVLGGQVRIKATLPVTPTITDDKNGRQVIVDVTGAEIGALPHILDLKSPDMQGRAGQFKDDVARIVLETRQRFAFSFLGGKPATQIVLNPVEKPRTVAAVTAAVTPKKNARTGAKGAAAPRVTVSIVSGVAFRRVSDEKAQIIVSADRQPQVRAALSRGRLTLDLLNSTLGATAMDALDKIAHPFLKAAKLVAAHAGAPTQLVLDLTRTVCYTLQPSGKGALLLELSLPRSAKGRLAGKTIVVDAGHGDHDGGARGVNGVSEKTVNLAIATQLAEALRDAGANVIMTRAGDTFIDVDERPVIANRAGADFFISIHADDAYPNRSVNGSTVYFHMDSPSCRALAQCIADRFGDMGGIRTKGPHSDGRQFGGRFVNGYGVLRISQMVAVLVECGYMSNSEDARRLCDPAMQKKIAASIRDGLRDYIEGNPDTDTRNVNPQPGGGLDVPPAPVPDQPPADGSSEDATPTTPNDTSL